MGRRRTSRVFSVVVALLMVCLFAAVGYRAGQIVAPSPADAASTWQSAAANSYSEARLRGYRATYPPAYERGWLAGIAAADTAGAGMGRAAGRARAAARAVAARALAAVLAATPRTLRRGVRTEMCVPVAGGLCEVLGPHVTGRPCPPGSVAYAEGGEVCLPRILLLISRTDK